METCRTRAFTQCQHRPQHRLYSSHGARARRCRWARHLCRAEDGQQDSPNRRKGASSTLANLDKTLLGIDEEEEKRKKEEVRAAYCCLCILRQLPFARHVNRLRLVSLTPQPSVQLRMTAQPMTM